MKVTETQLPGVVIVEPQVFADARGSFMESFSAARYANAGIAGPFLQDNVSTSRRGVLRGLHLQHPNGQGKLVSVLLGEVFDVAVDVRPDSPTFGKWVGEYLSEENRRQLYVPVGFAHGFVVTSERAVFSYKCTTYRDAASEMSVRWNDPFIGIAWPVGEPILSDKDGAAPSLLEIPATRLPSLDLSGAHA